MQRCSVFHIDSASIVISHVTIHWLQTAPQLVNRNKIVLRLDRKLLFRIMFIANRRKTRYAGNCIAHKGLCEQGIEIGQPVRSCVSHLEQDFSPKNVANASNSCLVHEDGTDRLLANLHLLPQQLPIGICPQRIRPQLGCFLLVVVCNMKTTVAEHLHCWRGDILRQTDSHREWGSFQNPAWLLLACSNLHHADNSCKALHCCSGGILHHICLYPFEATSDRVPTFFYFCLGHRSCSTQWFICSF